jgi:hypothetical protein
MRECDHESTPTRKLAFVFVCQAGEWELKAMLLAASLRRHYGSDPDLIAAIPHPPEVWGSVAQPTLALLDRLGVRPIAIANPIDPGFPHANKIACLGAETAADTLVFLDSDMLCLARHDFSLAPGARIAVKPADLPAFADEEAWASVYAAAGRPLPSRRVSLSCDTALSLPFYNSGAIIMTPAFGRVLAAAWAECSRIIRNDARAPDRRLWSDQLGLAVALDRLGVVPHGLDMRHNHPTHIVPLDETQLPFFAHYHWPDVIRQEPVLRKLVQTLASEHPAIREAIEKTEGWRSLLRPRAIRTGPRHRRDADRTILITGISRSGTSYLCSLLDRHSNCVGLNETPELVQALANVRTPWALPAYLRQVRADVLDGKPIRNKLTDGAVTGDTAKSDRLGTYHPAVEDSNLVIAAKNTFAFLSSLGRIRHVMPRARIALCVRNPIDTIASWKTSFDHLARADLSIRLVGHVDDPWLAPQWRAALCEIERTTDLSLRRALLWKYLAERVLEDRHHGDLLIRYENLMADRDAVLAELLDGLPAGRPHHPLPPPAPGNKRDALECSDFDAIRSVCTEAAAALGLAAT